MISSVHLRYMYLNFKISLRSFLNPSSRNSVEKQSLQNNGLGNQNPFAKPTQDGPNDCSEQKIMA